MNRRGAVFAAAAVIALIACGGSEAPERGQPSLVGSDERAADTLEAHLIRHQRELVSAVAANDSTALARLMSLDVVVHDTRVSRRYAASLDGPRPEQMTYFEVLGGAMQERLDSAYSSFYATHENDRAIVFAFGAGDAVRVTWRRQPAGWTATQLMLMSGEAARRMMEPDG
jgi:DNA primase large subunit